jgi:predicted ATPase
VELAPIRDPALVLLAIAGVLGLRGRDTEPLSLTLKEHLRERKMLLVLDNFEHMVAAAPAVVELLWGCPHLKILVTSREAPHVRGERQFPVPPLSMEAAMQLFVERAREVEPGFALSEEYEEAIEGICAHMQGLPLAIELVAARVKLLPPKALLARLEKHPAGRQWHKGAALPLLVGGPRDQPDRHRTLRAAIGWSYDLLAPEEKRLFRRLGLFVGGFTPSAVEAICNARNDLGLDVMDGLLSLLDKSLIKREEVETGVETGEPDSAEGEPRCTMLEMVREYAWEQLEGVDQAGGGEASRVKEWFIEYYLALAQAAKAGVLGKEQKRWILKLDPEWSNMRVALRWAIDRDAMEVAAQMGTSLYGYWFARGLIGEGRIWLEEIIARASTGDLPPPLHVELYDKAGYLAATQSDLERATLHLNCGLALLRQINDDRYTANSLSTLAIIELLRGNYKRASTHLREALALYESLGLKPQVGIALHSLALVALFTGRYERAQSLEAEALSILLNDGDSWNSGLALGILGIAQCRSGQLARAEETYNESMRVLAGMGEARGAMAVALICMAEIAKASGDWRHAQQLYKDSLRMLSGGGVVFPPITFDLVGLGALAAMHGQAERAVTIFAALEGVGKRLGSLSVLPCNRAEYEAGMAAAREVVGEARWEWIWKRGMSMSLDEAIAVALGDN